MKTGTIRYIHIILETVKHLGYSRSEFLRSLNIPLDFMEGHLIRLPLPTIHFILEKAIEFTKTPQFGLVAGQRGQTSDFGIMNHVWMNVENIEEIFAVNLKYSKLMNESLKTRLEVGELITHYYADFDDCPTQIRDTLVAFDFSAKLYVGKSLVGKNRSMDIRFDSVYVTCTDLSKKSFYEKTFDCPIHFSQPSNFITLKTNILSMKIKNSDFRVKDALLTEVERIIPKDDTQKLIVDLSKIIMNMLSERVPLRTKDIAESINMSLSTLKRRLQKSDTTITDVCHKVKIEYAEVLLKDDTLTISEVAFKVGFSEPSTFHRFFKEKMGITPREYRLNETNN